MPVQSRQKRPARRMIGSEFVEIAGLANGLVPNPAW
jgi:hypothetical protein